MVEYIIYIICKISILLSYIFIDYLKTCRFLEVPVPNNNTIIMNKIK